MLRLKLILLVALLPLMGNAQDNGAHLKGRFHLNIGPEYRITPIYDVAVPVTEAALYTNTDKQNSGTGLNLDLEYFITDKLSLGFINSFRYDLVIADSREISAEFGVEAADYKLLMDYHLYLAYYFKVFGKGEFFINAGVSLLNRNSDFSVKEPVRNSDGELIGMGLYIGDYHYSANRLSLGYKKGRGKLSLGIYFTQQAPYFKATTSFIVPHIGYSYKIGKL